jgi:NTP pyrophosphatase (non-canonical NTP hydrolase)
MMEPTLSEISDLNRARAQRWHSMGTPWSTADWANAVQGEGGELLDAVLGVLSALGKIGNDVKKIRRYESGVSTSYNTPELAVIVDKVKSEIPDVYLYLDLLAGHLGLDMYPIIKDKFNLVSEAQGFSDMMLP